MELFKDMKLQSNWNITWLMWHEIFGEVNFQSRNFIRVLIFAPIWSSLSPEIWGPPALPGIISPV